MFPVNLRLIPTQMDHSSLSYALRSNPDLMIAVQSGCRIELAHVKTIPNLRKFLLLLHFVREIPNKP
jgi:hypothetical protein